MRRTLGIMAVVAAVTISGWGPAHGSGADPIRGTEGDDYLKGTAGKDKIVAGQGDDYLVGHGANDILMGGRGFDHLWGGAGDDMAYDGPGSSTVKLGKGDDTAVSDSDDALDRIDCGPGQDIIRVLNVGDQEDAFLNCEHIVDWSH